MGVGISPSASGSRSFSPEIDYNTIDKIRGLQVTIATTAKNDAEAIRLLELYGMPFIRDTVEA